jgi:hypothetical protein
MLAIFSQYNFEKNLHVNETKTKNIPNLIINIILLGL